ncbi:MAG TPA: hypothetical protein VLJ86_27335 [Ramlibacter sp.]|nr:hypothetical protein [Ramlibacter sp.]
MEHTNASSSFRQGLNTPPAPPTHMTLSPLSQLDDVGETASRRRVRSRSPEREEQPPSFRDFQMPAFMTHYNAEPPALRERETEQVCEDESEQPAMQAAQDASGAAVHKRRKAIRPLPAPQRVGFIFGNRAEHKGGQPPLSEQYGSSSSGAIYAPAHVSSSAAPRRAVGIGSSSSASVNEHKQSGGKRHPAPQVQPQAPAQPLAASPEEVSSAARAGVLRKRISAALERQPDHEAIYDAIEKWRFPLGTQTSTLAFDRQFLSAILQMLPQLDSDDQIETLGKAVGLCRSYYTYHGEDTLAEVEAALRDPLVVSHVSMASIVKFLKAADETGPGKNKNNEHAKLRYQFSRSHERTGIPQALCSMLITQAAAAAADMDELVAVARDFGESVSTGKSWRAKVAAVWETFAQAELLDPLRRERIRSALDAGINGATDSDFEQLQEPLKALEPGRPPAPGPDHDEGDEQDADATE